MKSFISIFVAFYYCFMGLFSTVEIRLNPDKYNYGKLTCISAPDITENADVDSFVQLKEVNMHYLKIGNGKTPLVFIHGNGDDTSALYDTAARFADDYTVYLIDERCHGKSTDTEKISYNLMGDDIYQFCKAMNLKNPVLIGHSDGAIVAITSAANYPSYYGGIVSMGANSKPESMWFQYRFSVKWRNTFNKDKLFELMLNGPDFTESFLAKVNCPTYVVSGDRDLMPVYDTYYIHSNIKGSDIKVLKGEDHSSYVEDSVRCYSLIAPWLQSKGL